MQTQIFHAARKLLSDYDAYGLLGMYGMHLLSTDQARQLLPETTGGVGRRLLDVGAGDGAITQALAPLFADVAATETSRVLRHKLQQRGYRALPDDLSLSALAGPKLDVIACLNVIDRCARPLSLLTRLRSMLAADGHLLLSVPLPLRPHVHAGGQTSDPEESLPTVHDEADESWEASATSLVERLLQPLGFDLERLSRIPYLSRGDAETPLYVLDAAIIVLRASPSH
jgi:SAM-dependent methyltransferase